MKLKSRLLHVLFHRLISEWEAKLGEQHFKLKIIEPNSITHAYGVEHKHDETKYIFSGLKSTVHIYTLRQKYWAPLTEYN